MVVNKSGGLIWGRGLISVAMTCGAMRTMGFPLFSVYVTEISLFLNILERARSE